MSNLSTRNLLTQEPQVTTFTENVKQIVGVNVELTQEDAAYDVNSIATTASHDLIVYADTIKIPGDIVLPGRNLSLFARRIVIHEGVKLVTSGVSAEVDFAPGELPIQEEKGIKGNRQGCDGSAGANGGTGGNAGNVTLAAKSLDLHATGKVVEAEYPAERVPDHVLTGELSDLVAPLMNSATRLTRDQLKFRFESRSYRFNLLLRSLNVEPRGELRRRSVKCQLNHNTGEMRFDVVLEAQREFKVSFKVRRDDLPAEYYYSFMQFEQQYEYLVLPCRIAATLQFVFNPESRALQLADVACDVSPLSPNDNIFPVVVGRMGVDADIAAEAPAVLAEILAGLVGEELTSAVKNAEASIKQRLQPLFQSPWEQVASIDGSIATTGLPGFHIAASGGSGGRGQDGQKGERGDRGERGESGIDVSSRPNKHWFPPEAMGKKGFRGGRGGNAGRSGAGGAGGNIMLLIADHPKAALTWTVSGGTGGGRAIDGEPGSGGAGGHGAVWTLVRPPASSPTGGYIPSSRYSHTAPDGPDGDAGPPARFNGDLGKSGPSGKVVFNHAKPGQSPAPPNTDEFAAIVKLEQLLLIQRHARSRFLSSKSADQFVEVAEMYRWLLDMSAPFVEEKCPIEVSSDDRQALAAIHRNALVEIARLQQGVDYFGNPFNWAPMLKLEYLSERTQELIAAGRIIEQEFSDLVEADDIALNKIESLQNSLQAFDASLDKARDSREVLRSMIESVAVEIDQLADVIDIQKDTVFQHQQKLRQAVIDAQCDLQTIMQVMSAIVSIGTAAIGTLDFISTGRELFRDYKDATDGLRQFLKDNKKVIKELRKTYKNTIKEFKGIYADMHELFSPMQPPDAAKIMVDRSEFREMIKPYLDEFSDAGELKNAVETFFDLVDVRNLRLLDYNAMVLEVARREAEAEQIKAEMRQVEKLKHEAQGQRAPQSLMVYMRSAYTRVRDHLIAKLYEMSRAYQMYAVSRFTPMLNSYSIATIADIFTAQRLMFDDYLTHAARLPGDLVKSIELTDLSHPAIFNAFVQTGRLEFSLNPDHPAFVHYTNVKIEEIEVELPGMDFAQGSLYLAIRLSGEHFYHVTDERTQLDSFAPPTRNLTFEYNYGEKRIESHAAVYRPEGHYCRLSPFCTWSINFRVLESSNSFLKLEDVKSVRLTLRGKGFGVK